MTSDAWDWLQETILSDPQQWKTSIGLQELRQENLHGVEQAQSRACVRMLKAALVQRNQLAPVSEADLLVLLRQVVRLFGTLDIPIELWSFISDRSVAFGLNMQEIERTDAVRIMAHDWIPDWLPSAENVDQLFRRRDFGPVLGDGMLLDFMIAGGKDVVTYQSEGQRQAVWEAIFAPPGSTTLITLPTGAGKSLAAYLPAWIDSKRGTYAGGTTIVVVPTVALAIDQSEAARRHFRGSNSHYLPYYLASDTSEDVRNIIRAGVRNGTIPLLFVSPESLIGSEFRSIVLDATREGKVKRIVVDEAHLIDTWGAGFRTDFQFLSTYFRKLYVASNQQLRVLLLSATISPESLETLEQLFILPSGRFCHLQVNQLRPEISYWMVNAAHPQQKLAFVAESLRHLPRPAILYLTAPDDAERYYRSLKNKDGYKRIATFTGKTPPQKRLQLIQDWREDRIDLMVATSAFGLGVDKPDVRAIVHAAFPESIDRFYQEVGRGGRDGCSSISLLITTDLDRDYAIRNSLKSRITVEKAWPRWSAMLQHARSSTNGIWTINRQMTPAGSMRESEINRDWNEHVLLLMQRAGIIRVADINGLQADHAEEYPSYDELQIEILRHHAVNHFDGFREVFEIVREQERDNLIEASKKLKHIFHEQTDQDLTCLAHGFERVYSPVGLACGGCPGCRRAERAAYADPAELDITSTAAFRADSPHHAELQKLMGHHRTLLLLYETEQALSYDNLAQLIPGMIYRGVAQVMLTPDQYDNYGEKLIRKLQVDRSPAHMIFTYTRKSIRLQSLPILGFLSEDTMQSDAVYHWLHQWQISTEQQIIYVLPRKLRLPKLHGLFIDRVNGHQQDLDRFLKQLQNLDYTL